MRPLLCKLVSPYQSAFIPGRCINENQIILQELLHKFKRRKVKGGFVALKMDLQKAYYRVNWKFVGAVLKGFGFHDIFLNWILECVSSFSFFILINKGKSKSFRPTRGLRQGDPLSPYLFILYQEILSWMLEKELLEGRICGVQMNQRGSSFTHLMYADDIVLFAKTNCREVQILDECLAKYCL